MLGKDTRYDPVDALWRSVKVPPITRSEAEHAEALLIQAFDRKEDRSPTRPYILRNRSKARRCWLSSKPGYDIQKGWARLVHDMGHRIFRHHRPRARPHDVGHESIELAMAQYVVTCGWLDGKLRPYEPSIEDRRMAKLANIEARITRWTTKAKRAATALRKLNRQRKRLTS